MTARQLAERDIKAELSKTGKCFLAFRKDLNPVMRKLVSRQIKAQSSLNPFKAPSHSTSQLVAHCFFSKSNGLNYDNYEKYYK